MPPRPVWRSTIRVRLTVLYSGAFFLAGAALVVLMYVFLGQALNQQMAMRISLTDDQVQAAGEAAPAGARVVFPEAAEGLHAQFRQDRDATLSSMLIASLMSLGVIGLIAGGFGWLLAGQALHPLQQITATARRVADRSLHERIALEGPNDEIKDLADTFDAMLERLDRSFDVQRRIVANASHELRTPLTINRTLLEVALDDPDATERLRQLCANLLTVNERHERLIDGLLTLASSEERVADPVPVDLADVVRHVVVESHDAARTSDVDLRVELSPSPVAGDPVLLERLVQNLVDNAVRYNLPQGGWVSVVAEVDGSDVRLGVENSGPHVPQYEVPSLFQPFRRLVATDRRSDASAAARRRGAGLGLSIVQGVARAHGGSVTAVPRREGGLTVQVRLPVLDLGVGPEA